MPKYSVFCSTADGTRTNMFWVNSRDRLPTREEAEAIRLLLGPFFWSACAPNYSVPYGMTLTMLEGALLDVTGVNYALKYANKTLFIV